MESRSDIEQRSDMLELSQGFAQLSGEVRQAGDTPAALQRIVELAVKFIDDCSYATITQLRGGRKHCWPPRIRSAVSWSSCRTSSARGPGWTRPSSTGDYLISDLIEEARWPRFAALARRATDVRGVLAFRIAARPQPSILSLYTVSSEGFLRGAPWASRPSSPPRPATLIALLAAEDHSANLETALASSREIGMALGILMAHRKITNEAAFDLLRTASQNLHRKLRDVASEVMETGTLPELPPKRAQ